MRGPEGMEVLTNPQESDWFRSSEDRGSGDSALKPGSILVGGDTGVGTKNTGEPIGVRVARVLGDALDLPVGRDQEHGSSLDPLLDDETAHPTVDVSREDMTEVVRTDAEGLSDAADSELGIREVLLYVTQGPKDQGVARVLSPGSHRVG